MTGTMKNVKNATLKIGGNDKYKLNGTHDDKMKGIQIHWSYKSDGVITYTFSVLPPDPAPAVVPAPQKEPEEARSATWSLLKKTAQGTVLVAGVAVGIYLIANNATGVGIADAAALIFAYKMIEYGMKAFS